MSDEKTQVGLWLRDLRDEAGLTQAQVASELSRYGGDVGAQTISHWENGRQLPSATHMMRLLVVYGLLDADTTGNDTERRDRFVQLVRRATSRHNRGFPGRHRA